VTLTRILRPQGNGRFVLFCDHASNHVPVELDKLGLPETELARHIAFDIGAAGLTEALSDFLDAPAILCGISRLVIDCNRQLDSPALIPVVSDGTTVPGNVMLSDAARKARIQNWFHPYHDAVECVLLDRKRRSEESIVVAIHSMTPSLDGYHRPWQIALSSATDRRLTEPVLAALRAPGDLIVGDNLPFRIETDVDYSIPFHALRRGLLHLQVEIRQDEIADAENQRRWAIRLASVLTECTQERSGKCG
jgi:predicted N-formylglutamate amidohydrolase